MSLKTFFSDIVCKTFLLQQGYNSFPPTLMKMKFVLKKINQIFKKINTYSPLYIENEHRLCN